MEKHEHPAKVLLDGSGFIGVRFVLLVLSDLERRGCTMRLEETRILEDSVSLFTTPFANMSDTHSEKSATTSQGMICSSPWL
jgi:hypothetical protein